jgi:aspartate 1-decarboxylase
MLLQLLKGKIHKARITMCDIDYEGSLEIDSDILEKAGILPYEKILVVNATNGKRLETYAIAGKAGSKVFCLNGAAAHRGSIGDTITIMCFASFTEEEASSFKPRVVVLDEKNDITAIRLGREPIV